MSTIKNKVVGGVFWTSFESIINRGFDFFIQLFLARLLFPEDYGVVGMAVTFLAFIEVFNDLGLGAAIVQKKKEYLTSLHYDTAFWSGVVWSFFIYLLIYFIITPFSVNFYGVEKLNQIFPILSLSILISPINLIHRAQLVKNMHFKKLAFVNNISNISAGLIALLLAFQGAGVWSLIVYSLGKVIVAVPLFFYTTKWMPSLNWERTYFKEIFGFGVYTTGTSFTNIFAQKIDYLLVGKFVGAVALGHYTFAFLITNNLRNQIVGIVNKVMYPIYTTLQDDPKRMSNLYLKILTFNNLLVTPLILFVFLFSDFFIPIFFGNNWIDSILILKILCISVFIQMLNNSNQSLFRAYGKVKIELKLQVVKTFVFFIPLITLGVIYKGIIGAAIGYTLAILFSLFYTTFHMNKIFGLSLLKNIKAVKSSLILLVISFVIIIPMLKIMDWRICLMLYFLLIIIIYGYFAKYEISMLINILKGKKFSVSKE